MMYLLTQPDGARPTIVDDRNFYRPAGVKKWVKNGFLNKDIKLPLGAIWSMRTQIEADLLLQNLMLIADAMGLGALDPRLDLAAGAAGRPEVQQAVRPDAGLRLRRRRDGSSSTSLRWQIPLPQLRQPARQRRRAAPQGRASDQGEVPALLRQHGRGGRRGDGRQVRAGRHLQRRRLFDRIYSGEFGETLPQARRATTPRT